MANQSSRELQVLHALLEMTRDSVAGYREAAAEAGDSALRMCFLRRARERENLVERLIQTVRSLGGDAEGNGTLLGNVHRVFMNLRDSVSQGDIVALHEVARGEHFLRGRYEAALGGNDLSPRARDAVGAAFGSVWAGAHGMRRAEAGRHARPRAM